MVFVAELGDDIEDAGARAHLHYTVKGIGHSFWLSLIPQYKLVPTPGNQSPTTGGLCTATIHLPSASLRQNVSTISPHLTSNGWPQAKPWRRPWKCNRNVG